MNNADILAIAVALTTDARVMGYRNIELWYVPGGEPLFQVRTHNGPAGVEVLPFPATENGLIEARVVARAKAELATI